MTSIEEAATMNGDTCATDRAFAHCAMQPGPFTEIGGAHRGRRVAANRGA